MGSLTLIVPSRLNAQATLFWDTNGATLGIGTATGTWTSSSTNWGGLLSGVLPPGTWTAGSIGYFSNGGSGTVTITGAQSVAGIVVNMNTLPTFTGDALAFGGNNAFTVASGSTVTMNSDVTGTAGLVFSGGGLLSLNGTKSYTGTTAISGTGTTLLLGTNNVLSDTSAVTVGAGATFSVNGMSDTVGSIAGAGSITLGTNAALTTGVDNTSTTFSGVMSGTGGALIKTGTGALTLSGTTANTFTSSVAVNDGTLNLNKTAGVNALGGTSLAVGDGVGAAASANVVLQASNQMSTSTAATINADGNLQLNTGVTQSIAQIAGTGQLLLSGTGALTIGADNSSSTFGGTLAGSGSLTKSGTGSLTITQGQNFSGALNATGVSGTPSKIVLSGATNTLGTVNLNNGELDISATAITTIGTLHITGASVIDFGTGAANTLSVGTFIIDAGATLTILNWTKDYDKFFATNWSGGVFDTSGITPMNQVTFVGWSASDTRWLSGDKQVYVPEPSSYGLILISICGALSALILRLKKKVCSGKNKRLDHAKG